jgi:hypothetical protein
MIACPPVCLAGMTKTRLRRTPSSRLFGTLCLFIGICLLFVIWCSNILINAINKYFAKNGQKAFIKGLKLSTALTKVWCIIIPLDFSNYLAIINSGITEMYRMIISIK